MRPTRRYRSPNIPFGVIRTFVQKLGEQFQPDKVILFGSFAYGKPREDSDVDLLVVMPATNEINQAVRIRRALEAPFPLDLVVRTPDNLRRRLAEEDWFLREVMDRGKVLYEKTNATLN